MYTTSKEIIKEYSTGFIDELQHHLGDIVMSLPEDKLADIILSHLSHSSPHISFINVIIKYNAELVKR